MAIELDFDALILDGRDDPIPYVHVLRFLPAGTIDPLLAGTATAESSVNAVWFSPGFQYIIFAHPDSYFVVCYQLHSADMAQLRLFPLLGGLLLFQFTLALLVTDAL